MARAPRHAKQSQGHQVQCVAAYLRVSTEEQRKSGLGLGDQRERVQAMAKERGWPSPNIFADEGISGSKGVDKRPALQQLLEAVRHGEVDAVMILSLDRLARDARMILNLEEELNRHHTALVSCKEELETVTANGRLLFTIYAGLAEHERRQVSERTKAALAQLSQKTGETGGRMPYGYVRLGHRQIARDPEAAKVVVRIFALHRRGESTRKIAERLRADQIQPPQRASTWHHTAISCILRNRATYAGGLRGASPIKWPAILQAAA